MRLIKLVLGVVLLFSCNDDSLEGGMLSPLSIVAKVGDETVAIKIFSAQYGSGYFAKPDSYELLVSTDPKAGFSSTQTKYSRDAQGFKVEKLVNGRPYYFTLLTHKKGLPTGHTDTIMVIPSETAPAERLLIGFKSYLAKVTLAPDGQRMAFLSSNVSGFHTPDLRLYTYNIGIEMDAEAGVSLLEKQVMDAEWSPAGDLIAAVRGTETSSEIVVFKTADGTSSLLPLQMSNPKLLTFSPDGSWLVYAGHNGDYQYQVWKIKPDGSENEKVFDTRSFSFIPVANGAIQGVDVSLGFETLLLSLSNGRCFGIHEYKILTGELQPILDDGWRNLNPRLSPDNSTMVFFSSRSGAPELWLYHLRENTLSQLTGKDEELAIIPEYSKLIWADNATVMFTAHKQSMYGIANKLYQVKL